MSRSGRRASTTQIPHQVAQCHAFPSPPPRRARARAGRPRLAPSQTQDTHIDREVLGGAGDVARGRQALGYVLQGEACWVDFHRQPHHKVPLGASERPAVPWIDVRLEKRQNTTQLKTGAVQKTTDDVEIKIKKFYMVKNHKPN